MVDDKWVIVIERELIPLSSTKGKNKSSSKPKKVEYNIYAQKGITKNELEKKKGFVFTGREIQQVFNPIEKTNIANKRKIRLGKITSLKDIDSKKLYLEYRPFDDSSFLFNKIRGKGIASRIELRVYKDLFKIFGNYELNGSTVNILREKQLKERYEIAGRDEKTYPAKGKFKKKLERNLADEIKYLETFLREKQKEKMRSPMKRIMHRVKRVFRSRAK